MVTNGGPTLTSLMKLQMYKEANTILGMYGISKDRFDISGYSIVEEDEALSVLCRAKEVGISSVDTSPGYGGMNADRLLKESRRRGVNLYVIGKVGLDIDTGKYNGELVERHTEYLMNQHGCSIKGILIHNMPKELLRSVELEKTLEKVQRICGSELEYGVSICDPSDCDVLEERLERGSVVQANLSWFDLRLLRYLCKLRDYKIVGRSIFGSGIIPIILSASTNRERLRWLPENIKAILGSESLKSDRARVMEVSNIIGSMDSSEVAVSLLRTLEIENNFSAIIGPLCVEELDQTMNTFKKMSLGLDRIQMLKKVVLRSYEDK